MRKPCRLAIGILMVMLACVSEAFHLEGRSSVRRSICARAPPCCRGHVCRAYQRFDSSRPVAACATSIHARPIYAPGSPAQRRICGSTSGDVFSRRTPRFRSRSSRTGQRLFDRNSFDTGSSRSQFPPQFSGSQQWGRSDSRFRFSDRDFGSQDRMDRISDRSRFGSSIDSGRFRPRGLDSQLNSRASVPQERLPMGSQGQFRFGQGRSASFSQGASSFPQGQRSFGDSPLPQSFSDSSVSQSFRGSSMPQSFSDSSVSQSFSGSSMPQSFSDSSVSQSFSGSSMPQSFSDSSISQSFGDSSGPQSFSRSRTFSQDTSSFLPSQSGGSRESQEIMNQLRQIPDLGQGLSRSTGSQPISQPSGGFSDSLGSRSQLSFTDRAVGFTDLLPQAPQPRLMEQPAISVSPISGPVEAGGFTDLLPQIPQTRLMEQPAVSVSQIAEPVAPGGFTDLLPQIPQTLLMEQPAVSVSQISGSVAPGGFTDLLPQIPQTRLMEQPAVSVSQISGSVAPGGFTDLLPQIPQTRLMEQQTVSVSPISGSVAASDQAMNLGSVSQAVGADLNTVHNNSNNNNNGNNAVNPVV